MNDASGSVPSPSRPQVTSGSAEEQLSRIHLAQPSQGFQPAPEPTGKAPYRLSLEEAVGSVEAERLQGAEQIVFHVIGDSGGVKYGLLSSPTI